MSASPEAASGLEKLDELRVDNITKNPKNPRVHFPRDEMDRLSESIARKGVLVPIVVYRQEDHFVLIDGERRWRCAQELGLETVPAVIREPPDDEENLVQMFNIHMVREAWKDMPTARALGEVIDETGVEKDRELADLTGLSTERIKRLRHALELPSEYQDYIDKEQIPLNFFWELKRNVIDPLAKKRPTLAAEFGDREVLDAFVEKRLRDVITDVVSLRLVAPIINYAARDVDDLNDPSPLDDTIRSLVRDPNASVVDAYEDTVQVVFETDKLGRRADNVVKSFERLIAKARNDEEQNYVRKIGKSLVERVAKIVK